MFTAPANNLFNRPNQVQRDRSRSRERRPKISPEDQGIGYGCTVYQDYLILLGTTREVAERGESVMCAYNLREKRPQEVESERVHIAIGSCTACFFPRLNGVIFYGTIESKLNRMITDPSSHQCTGASFQIERGGGRLHFRLMKDPSGPGSALSVCHCFEESIYVYDPNSENANFGTLQSLSERGGGGWTRFHAGSNNIKLHEPSRHAVFVNDVLYIFAANVDSPRQSVETGCSIIEDIYALDLKKVQKSETWERILPFGRAPGAMTNISLAEDNERIYLFGLSEGKSVLWVYDINGQEWKQVRDIGTLAARPDQKAVVYGGKLLIVNWGYSRESIQIQYLSLDGLNFVASSPNGKTMCKDQAENFVQDAKNLYKNKSFPDVIFEVEGEEIPAHKAVLAYRSDYFMKMFTSGMSESHSAKISIPHIKSFVFRAILQYIYCNEVELDEQLAVDLIPVVDEYVMKGLKGVIERYLCKQLRKENVVDMLLVADRHEIFGLKEACFKFILKNLDNIDENEEMMKLSKSLFLELFKFQTLGAQKEKSKPKEEEHKSSFSSAPKQIVIEQRDIQLARRIRGERF